jgi:hypothetical protein
MGVPHGILRVFNPILYENEFQNPQIFQQTISVFFPEHFINKGEHSLVPLPIYLGGNKCFYLILFPLKVSRTSTDAAERGL